MHEETIAGLRTVMAGGPDRRGGGTGPVVALFHGFGANGDDLVGLWRAVDVPRDVRFVFPEAPLALAGYGGASYAWWMIDIGRWQSVVAGLTPPERFMDEVPEGLADARAGAAEWLAAVSTRLGVGADRLVLGGFSQGATLAVDLALRAPAPPAGLVVLSGALVASAEWGPLLERAHGVPFFQSHGTQDPILPFVAGEALNVFLNSGPYRGELQRFRGGHEIPFEVVERLGKYLRARLAAGVG